MKTILLAVLVLSGIAVSANQDVSDKMKALKVQLDLLDMQRDLVRINYPLLNAIGDEIKFACEEIIKRNPENHLDSLMNLADQARDLSRQALENSHEAMATAVRLEKNCIKCHGGETPSSGIKWSEISQNNWDWVIPRCNQISNNPYLCKQMHGLKTISAYYDKSAFSGVQTFLLAEQTALEMQRIARDLNAQGFDHGGQGSAFVKISQAAGEVAELAHNRDIATYERSRILSNKCMACHSGRL